MKYKPQHNTEPFWGAFEKNNKDKNKIKRNTDDINNINSKKVLNNEKKEKQKVNSNHYFSSVKDGNITSTRLVATMKDLCTSDKEKLAKLITKLAIEETKNQKLELKNKNYKSLLLEERIKNEQLLKTHNG
ncbi:hypothetical protein BCR36DRAFT_288869 [Piromyces finnis]|uniref:Uncharacterized protein n=1 Tax=Piromyces finnis TaxID=1754191 RepID=A0A1Y1VA74_9FUNG|nr:hypothetical protein BCR36DRAFT_288869 [Piromyces finnis]|eukprot:ORX51019.1 hypothetical protein BCR36DRAFT_288869 [Piromyces finnis]